MAGTAQGMHATSVFILPFTPDSPPKHLTNTVKLTIEASSDINAGSQIQAGENMIL